ncbi:MAG: cytochrome c-type biogenesis protein [Pseudomonadota bacterium]|nr:cytochrome c-type biogenesis protein [Pseudomonadota bacterium]
MMRRLLPFLLLLLAPALFAAAPIEDVAFADAEEQARYDKLIAELRCPKCLNSNLAGSDAPIAASLRTAIREQIAEGRSDEEIIEFMTARYGDFVLYRPRLTAGTAALWFGPPVLLLLGFFVLRRMLVAARARHDENLSPEELQKLQTLLDDEDGR